MAGRSDSFPCRQGSLRKQSYKGTRAARTGAATEPRHPSRHNGHEANPHRPTLAVKQGRRGWGGLSN